MKTKGGAVRNLPVPLTADLLRRLANMVAGAPKGDDFYIVVVYNGRDHDFVLSTRGVPWRANKAMAERQARAMRTKPNPQRTVVAVQALGPFKSPQRRADKNVVKVRGVNTNAGSSWQVDGEVDMICWSPSAFDKFVAPYYYQLYGTGVAASRKVEQLRRRMLQSPSGIMSHRWPTSPGIVFRALRQKAKEKERA